MKNNAHLKTFILVFLHAGDALEFSVNRLLTSTLHHHIRRRHRIELNRRASGSAGTQEPRRRVGAKQAATDRRGCVGAETSRLLRTAEQ